MSLQTCPPNCDGLEARQAWRTPADGRIRLRRIPSKVLTPFQDQPVQGDPHTLPGPVYLSEYVLPPLWQTQDYSFTTIYTAIPHEAAYRQLHE